MTCFHVPGPVQGDFINKLWALMIILHWLGLCIDVMERQSFLPNLTLLCLIPGILPILGSTRIRASISS